MLILECWMLQDFPLKKIKTPVSFPRKRESIEACPRDA